MPSKNLIRFDDVEIDRTAFELRRDGKSCPVEPQVFELLAYLADNPDRLVTKDELIEKIWGGRIVSDAALASRIKAARRAIGDDGERQRLIRTVHGRGFRFIGDIAVAPTPERAAPALSMSMSGGTGEPLELVGRAGELEHLRGRLDAARAGRRQTIFVTGEAGIGKTTLLETFVRRVEAEFGIAVGHGQCLEHRGEGEAYMPVLEAFGRLCKGPRGPAVVAQLAERAPSWLLQMPWLVPTDELELLRRRASGNVRERMLREMAEAVETLTIETPLLLVLEDLHWSDPSTIELIVRLAQRREPARLMVVGTYRPSELNAPEHPLRRAVQELRLRALCDSLALPMLDEAAVHEFVARRLPRGTFPAGFARVLYERTEGNPLFIANLIEMWIASGLVVQRERDWCLEAPLESLAGGVPEDLRQLIEQQLDRLDPATAAILEGGSVIGREFAVAVVAAAAERDKDEVDGIASTLARQGHFLRAAGTVGWPDGTVTPQYGFLHDLYRTVVYERIPASRIADLHGRAGMRLETGYGALAAEHAAELASHFSRGRKAARSIGYAQLAAEQVLRRGGHGEAIAYVSEGLGALSGVEDRAQRERLEFGLQITRATAAIAAQGYGADATEQAYRRARELSAGRPADPRHFQAVYGLFLVRWNRAQLREAAEIAQEMLAEAEAAQDRVARCVAYRAVAVAANALADFSRAHAHAVQAVALHDPERDGSSAAEFAQDIGVGALMHRGLAEWHLGRTADSAATVDAALARARLVAHANTVAYALFFAAYRLMLARQGPEASALASELVAFADERFMEYWAATGRCVVGAAAVIRGDWQTGRSQVREGLERLHAGRIPVFRPTFLGFLAEAETGLGHRAEAAQLLTEALAAVDRTHERWYEPQLRRLWGEIAAPADAASGAREPRSPIHRQAVRESTALADGVTNPAAAGLSTLRQEIRFCTASDGVRIAYATVGEGPPLMRPANWMTHLEYDWQSPVWRHWVRELARDHRLIRYDERANGHSDWDVEDLSFEAMVRDFEAVVAAAGLERFPVVAVSQGCAVAVAYAARHPDRVTALVLYGGYARGWAKRDRPKEVAVRTALGTLIEHGWGQDNPAFRQVFTSMFIPEASPEQMRWFNDLLRVTASARNAVRLHHTFGEIDVTGLLGQLRVPTLVVHCRNDQVVHFEEGRLLAAMIPDARFVLLEGRNHIMLADEPAWERFLDEVRQFLRENGA